MTDPETHGVGQARHRCPFSYTDPVPTVVADLPAHPDGVRAFLLAHAEIHPGDQVLDLGDDAVLLAAALSATGPGGQVTALCLPGTERDISRPTPDGGILRRASRADLVGSPAFQAVLGRAVLTGTAGLDGVMDETAGLLAPDGRLVLFEPVLARRWHDPSPLPGITSAETTAIRGALLAEWETTEDTANSIEDDLCDAVRRAGMMPTAIGLGLARTEIDAGAVESYLSTPICAGSRAWRQIITDRVGADVAQRYVDAWHTATAATPVAVWTPILFLTATPVEDPKTAAERARAFDRNHPDNRDLLGPAAAWVLHLALDQAREHETAVRRWGNPTPTIYVDRYIDL